MAIGNIELEYASNVVNCGLRWGLGIREVGMVFLVAGIGFCIDVGTWVI